MPPKAISLRTVAPQTVYQQSVDTFTADTHRRAPTNACRTVCLYYWMPSALVSTIPAREWQRTLRELVTLGHAYYPRLKFTAMTPMMEVKESKDMITKYRGDTYYNAAPLLDMIPLPASLPATSSSLSSSSASAAASSSSSSSNNSSIYARVMITSHALVTQSSMLTAGFARRTTGVACYSLSHDAPMITFIHEFAHLLGLHHCATQTCIMVAGTDGAIVKSKTPPPSTFCASCQAKVDVACSTVK